MSSSLPIVRFAFEYPQQSPAFASEWITWPTEHPLEQIRDLVSSLCSKSLSTVQVSRGMLVNLGIGLVVLFAAASVVISSYVAEAQRRSGGPHRYKLDVQVLGSNWGTAQATEPFQGPFATEAGQTDSIEERRVGKLRQADEPQIEMDQDESEDGVEDLPTLEEGKVLTEIHNYPVVNSTAPKRVALLFFGLQRSLSLTLLSIQRRVINKLTDVGYEVTVFVHQFEDLGKEDKHSKGVRWKWWTMLRPFDHSLTSQATFLKNHRCASFAVMSCIANTLPLQKERLSALQRISI